MKADLHLHSKYSNRPSEWFLRRIGAPESFVEPETAYRICRERGMDYVTLTDHNCIDGALSIAHLPNTFLSVEITTYFPEDGCKIHCLAYGINERQFAEIEQCRENIYDLQQYLTAAGIAHAIAHPLFRVNDRLTVDHVEKLLLLFPSFERINGARHDRAGDLLEVVISSLTPAVMSRMADRQGVEPRGNLPWCKKLTGGSDDHSGVYAAMAYTETPDAGSPEEFVRYLAQRVYQPGGQSGTSLRLAHSLYHIACGYYHHRFSGNGTGNRVIAELLRRISEAAPPSETTQNGTLRSFGQRLVRRYRINRMSPIERELVETIGPLIRHRMADTGDPDQRTFQVASRVGQHLGYAFVKQLMEHAGHGRLIESLQAFASLGPVALSFAPYVAAFGSQHKDETFFQALCDHFPAAKGRRHRRGGRVWVTDTFNEVNGVAFSIRTIAGHLRRRGIPVQVVTAMDGRPAEDDPNLRNFPPLGAFAVPEYAELKITFPPFLEILEYFERQNFSDVIISTPGALGLIALAAARLLGLRSAGIYHTDIPRYVRCLTDDESLEPVAWRAMQWFYGQMDCIYVPSRYYLELLAGNGFDREKMQVLPRGVDVERFSPMHRDPEFWRRRGMNGGLKYLYVGRVSREKNLDVLLDAFRLMPQTGCPADLLIVGDGPDRSQLENRFGDPRIRFTGYLHGEELAKAYASSDVFVFPSATDTFGNVVLEAQASGLPAIVSDQGGPPEIIAAHTSGLVVPAGQPAPLAAAMGRLGADQRLRDELSRRALITAKDYNWDAALADF